ncbi:uncharacterized protein B0P05DRAFT_526814 [Gilbertella persicaria]|uniref:Uncharacterized protein n=1 Tax=Rhizopus stolonifer TaxID=4846 RepID=A0A367IKD8_RHIST|nr:uncharacterized protein B0P05DRAFT_526814 [Gilbertella persicaria]KAI8091268.1 hypothetical protein B0P05DRAFT_526814 [Gilbertella persicaria]RCH78139.1 hypothetical protein CU098_005070 [Rhizopus stolonifer]
MSFFHHQDKNKTNPTDKQEDKPKEPHHHHHFFQHDKNQQDLPKGFANDAMRSSKSPDTLYNFDDPMARRLGPVPSSDPTNTGA